MDTGNYGHSSVKNTKKGYKLESIVDYSGPLNYK